MSPNLPRLRSSVSNRTWVVLPVVLAVVWLFSCQVAFFFIQRNQGLELSRAMQAQFRSDLFRSDFEYLTRAVSDLEVLGTIRCPHVEQVSPRLLVLLDLSFRGGCVKNPWLLAGGSFDTLATASNGDQYVLHFSTESQAGFLVGLWVMRWGGLLLLGALYLFHQVRSAQAARVVQFQVQAAQTLNSLASQVSHDIRSPLSALNMVVASLKELPEDKRLIIRSATQRINDIANGLLQQGRQAAGNAQHGSAEQSAAEAVPMMAQVMLVALLDAIVSEKREYFRGRMEIEIQEDLDQGYGLFAWVNAAEFARAISNLVNNSVEAMSSGGRVAIAIRGHKDRVTVTISDNGKGIPSEVLVRLGERGVSHGKAGTESGSGLGVFHARETVEKAGGTFAIQSQIGLGTIITLTLPRMATPQWFVEKINVSAGTTVVSVDDDSTIHQIWAGRLSSAGAAMADVQHVSFSSMAQFESWTAGHGSMAALFLVDYEFLGQMGSGLDLIERTGVAENAILVTSRYEEPQVRARAEALGVRILPKTLAPFVPLEIEKARERYDAILLDDDTMLVHASWQMMAKEKGKRILCFSAPDEFLKKLPEIDLGTPIFIDVSLANGARGEDIARETIGRGFTQVFLATGHAADSIAEIPGLKGIVGKDPCF